MALVEIVDVHKSFGPLHVLDGINMTIEQGEIVAIIGRSGSGKSTLLRCLNGLGMPDSGTIGIAGHHLPASGAALRALRQDVGMVFQSYNLFPHLSVERNITLAPQLVRKLPRAEGRELALQALERVGLADKIDAYPEQLSGGQQQRVAIARSLAVEPKVMLFDEVTSALDPEWTYEVLKVIEGLAQSGMTMALVTHEMRFAARVATTLVFMHQGKIWEKGRPGDLFAAPQTKELANFLAANF
jgi:polar amino acid transport system ATP-binding protein